MGEDDPGERRVEGGGDGGSDPAADADVAHPAFALVDPGDRRAERRAEMRERPVLSGRSAGAEGDDAGQGREQAGAGADAPVEALHRAHDVGRPLRTALRDELVDGAHHQPAECRHQDRDQDEESGISHLCPPAGRDEEAIVEQGHQVDEEHRGKRRHRADREPQDRDRRHGAGHHEHPLAHQGARLGSTGGAPVAITHHRRLRLGSAAPRRGRRPGGRRPPATRRSTLGRWAGRQLSCCAQRLTTAI